MTKKFRLKENGMDRVAFYVPSTAGASLADLRSEYEDMYTCSECNDDADYFVVGSDGNAADCQAHTVTDGTRWWTVATDTITAEEEAILKAQARREEA